MGGGVALVQGASRGLGLQFCRYILNKHPDSFVLATCRDPSAPKSVGLLELQSEFGGENGRLKIRQLDVADPQQVLDFGAGVKEIVDRLDLLVNCAGMLHPSGKGETSLRDVSFEGLAATMATNAIGPLLVTKSVVPLLQKGGAAFCPPQCQKDKKDFRGVVVNVSARVGSIGDNALGGWYSYRMSKTALNMATRNLSIELGRGSKKVACVALHPGTVDTELSRPYHKNVPEGKLFSVPYSVDSMMNVVENINIADSGKYMAWDGTDIPY